MYLGHGVARWLALITNLFSGQVSAGVDSFQMSHHPGFTLD